MPKYHAKLLEKVDNGKGYWNYSRMGIFDGENKIGEYVRKYSAYGEKTFFPFEKDGKWYAIYSEDYTCTYLMSLPDCKKIGGEEPKSNGFCPVEYYIPRYRKMIFFGKTEEQMILNKIPKENWHWVSKDDISMLFDNEDEEFDNKNEFIEEKDYKIESDIYYYLGMAFVAGCVFGDDSSWKLQRLDLTNVDKGIIKRTDDFGYVELPPYPLKECVRLNDYGNYITLHIQKHYAFKDGKIEFFS